MRRFLLLLGGLVLAACTTEAPSASKESVRSRASRTVVDPVGMIDGGGTGSVVAKICGERPDCAIHARTAAGLSADHGRLEVVVVRVGASPTDPTDCQPLEHWAVVWDGTTLAAAYPLLFQCDRGDKVTDVDRVEVTTNRARLVHSSGGWAASSQSEESRLVQLWPRLLLEEGTTSWMRTGPGTTLSSWDWRRLEGRARRGLGCDENRVREIGLVAQIDALSERSFAEDGWRTTSLRGCATAVDPGTRIVALSPRALVLETTRTRGSVDVWLRDEDHETEDASCASTPAPFHARVSLANGALDSLRGQVFSLIERLRDGELVRLRMQFGHDIDSLSVGGSRRWSLRPVPTEALTCRMTAHGLEPALGPAVLLAAPLGEELDPRE